MSATPLNILFYVPFNSRSRDTESLIRHFVKQRHKVWVLTQAGRGDYHLACERIGAIADTFELGQVNPIIFFLRQAWHLVSYCRRRKIDVVYAHLEMASFPAVLAQYFIQAKVFAVRHVIDEAYLFKNRNFILLTRLVYTLARNVIVVSERCREFMVQREHVRAEKISVIFLAYYFDLYDPPVVEKVMTIRQENSCRLLLLTACRLVPPKRPEISIGLVRNLLSRGVDIKLILLGSGPERENLLGRIAELGLEDRVKLAGQVADIMNYIAAADVLIHPSLLDSSSVIIKEAGLLQKTVVTCRDVGDVNEYLVHNKNALLVSRENTLEEMTEWIERIIQNPRQYEILGKNLNQDIQRRFSIDEIIGAYNDIHAGITDHRSH
ncbi:MAG TPA: glycosyltransferase [Cyclobacteriaceae bacterium]|nr:glycosyltransferase [Cyclobacteriaceae bacterium]